MYSKEIISPYLSEVTVTLDYCNKCYWLLDKSTGIMHHGRLVFGSGRVVAICPDRGDTPLKVRQTLEQRGFYIVKGSPEVFETEFTRSRFWLECDMYDYYERSRDGQIICYVQGLLLRDDMLHIVDFTGSFELPSNVKYLLEKCGQRLLLYPHRNFV